MRIYSLLLSFILLMALMLSGEGKKEARNRHVSKARTVKTRTAGKPQVEQRSQSPTGLTKGKFVTQDQADCRWVVTEQEKGIVLKVDCTRQDTKFSCVFTGNPTSCLEVNKKSVYWKQIGRSLRSQKAICGDTKSVLKSRLCKKKFPESSLKLVNSTLTRSRKPSQGSMEPFPGEQGKVSEVSMMEPNKVQESSSQVKGTTAPKPAETRTVAPNDPECTDDPDLVNQKNIALHYCGESWGSFCKFFLTIVQGNSC